MCLVFLLRCKVRYTKVPEGHEEMEGCLLGGVEARKKFRDKNTRKLRHRARLNAPSFLLDVTVNPYRREESRMHVRLAERTGSTDAVPETATGVCISIASNNGK